MVGSHTERALFVTRKGPFPWTVPTPPIHKQALHTVCSTLPTWTGACFARRTNQIECVIEDLKIQAGLCASLHVPTGGLVGVALMVHLVQARGTLWMEEKFTHATRTGVTVYA